MAWEARLCCVYAFPVNAGNPSSPHLRCVSSCLFSLSIVVFVYVFPLSKIENHTSPLFWDCVILLSFSLWVWGCCLPLVLGCFLVAEVIEIVAEMFWPREGQEQLWSVVWPELCFTFWFGVVTLLSSSSSQSCELFVLLRYVVVGLQTIESRIRGWVCLRKLVFEATSLAFSLS